MTQKQLLSVGRKNQVRYHKKYSCSRLSTPTVAEAMAAVPARHAPRPREWKGAAQPLAVLGRLAVGVWHTAVSSQRLSTTCGGAQAPAPDKPPRTLCLVSVPGCRTPQSYATGHEGSGSLVALCLYEYAGYEDRLLTRAKSAYGSLKCT